MIPTSLQSISEIALIVTKILPSQTTGTTAYWCSYNSITITNSTTIPNHTHAPNSNPQSSINMPEQKYNTLPTIPIGKKSLPLNYASYMKPIVPGPKIYYY